MPHPTLGKIGWFLDGGACLEGCPQAVQVSEFIKAGIRPDCIVTKSVGALNGLAPERAPLIWKGYFYSPELIYDLHPDFKRLRRRIIEVRPRWRPHQSWADFFRDLKVQGGHILTLTVFCARTVLSILRILFSPLSNDGSPFQNLFSSPLFRSLPGITKTIGINKFQGIFDLTPLFTAVSRVVDFEKLVEGDCTRHILTRHNTEIHVFSTHLSKGVVRSFGSRAHLVSSKEDLLAAIRAATALPPFFEPVFIEGKEFRDLGSLNTFPIDLLFAEGCDTIFAFADDYSTAIDEDTVTGALIGESYRASRSLFGFLYHRALKRAAKEGRKLYLITPQRPPHPDLQLLWISPAAIEHTTRVEIEAMREFLSTLLA